MNDPVAALWHDVHPYQPFRCVPFVSFRSFVRPLVRSLVYCGSIFLISSSLRWISCTWSRRSSSGTYSWSQYDGTKISGFQTKPCAEARYVISRRGPSASSAPILMVVHSCWVNAELSRLGRRACNIFCFWEARDGVFGDGSGELGELE
jgi:hypothetical protein